MAFKNYRALGAVVLIGTTLILFACAERDSSPVHSAPQALDSSLKTASAAKWFGLNNMRAHADNLTPKFEPRYKQASINQVSRQVVAFENDGLKQSALILEPDGPAPRAGWPVVVFNHGTVPKPENYGRLEDGSTARPGNYYRGLPQSFAEAGFLVLVPDYRGHNDSAGLEQTRGWLAPLRYSRDVLAAIAALKSLPAADSSNILLWGHSMGGQVTLEVAASMGSNLRAASIWSTVSPDIEQQLAHYSKDESQAKAWRLDLKKELKAAGSPSDLYQHQPSDYLESLPALNIQHARGDNRSVSYQWSVNLAEKLTSLGKRHQFFSYEGEAHLFTGDNQKLALQRDIDWFRQHLQ